MSLEVWITYIFATTLILIIPGPTIILVVSQAVTHGRGPMGIKSLFLNQDFLNPGYKLVAPPPHKPGLLPRWLGEKGVNIIKGRRRSSFLTNNMNWLI